MKEIKKILFKWYRLLLVLIAIGFIVFGILNGIFEPGYPAEFCANTSSTNLYDFENHYKNWEICVGKTYKKEIVLYIGIILLFTLTFFKTIENKIRKFNFKIKPKHIILTILVFVLGIYLFSKTYSTITGELRFPANNTPVQIICAVNSKTKVETCTKNHTGYWAYGSPHNFVLRIKPGQYYLYSKIDEVKNDERWNDLFGYKAFYTEYSKNCSLENKNKKEQCNQIKINNKPILIEALPGKLVKEVNFDWNDGDYYNKL